MLLAVAAMLVMTIALAALLVRPTLRADRVTFETTPDHPCAFGYKMAWLAIRSTDTAAVAAAVGLTDARPCNWNSGIGTVYDEHLGETHVFVTPPVDGWTFVVGLPLPQPLGRSFVDKATPLLLDLAAAFEDVQYYFTYPLIDYYAWARFHDGDLVRAFAIGDEGMIWNKGKPTPAERALGLKLFELRGVRDRHGDAGGEIVLYPTEDHVMRVAARWSLDPTSLDDRDLEPGLGFVGAAPTSWRVERLRRTG